MVVYKVDLIGTLNDINQWVLTRNDIILARDSTTSTAMLEYFMRNDFKIEVNSDNEFKIIND